MKPAQLAVEISGSNAAAGTGEIREAGMSVVHGLDVEFATGTPAGRQAEHLVADPQGVLVQHRRQDRADGVGGDRRQHHANGRTGTIRQRLHRAFCASLSVPAAKPEIPSAPPRKSSSVFAFLLQINANCAWRVKDCHVRGPGRPLTTGDTGNLSLA